MTDIESKTAFPKEKARQSSLIWGGFIIDILQKLLEFNQMPWGIKKKF
jgi:hypothetical protein